MRGPHLRRRNCLRVAWPRRALRVSAASITKGFLMSRSISLRLAMVIASATALSAAVSAFAQVVVENPWVRGTIDGQNATAAYMSLKSPVDTALVEVASPLAKIAEIHEMKLEGS